MFFLASILGNIRQVISFFETNKYFSAFQRSQLFLCCLFKYRKLDRVREFRCVTFRECKPFSSTSVIRFSPCYNVTAIVIFLLHCVRDRACIDPVHYMQDGFRSQPPARRNRQTPSPLCAEHCFRCKALCSEINCVAKINGYISDFKASLTRYYSVSGNAGRELHCNWQF